MSTTEQLTPTATPPGAASWRHCKWFEDHPAQPQRKGAMFIDLDGRVVASCTGCKEAIIGPQVTDPEEAF